MPPLHARRLPYEYYMLPFCQPETLETIAENLGEVLRGDKIMNSNYELKMGVEETCKILCRKELTASETREFATRYERTEHAAPIRMNAVLAAWFIDCHFRSPDALTFCSTGSGRITACIG